MKKKLTIILSVLFTCTIFANASGKFEYKIWRQPDGVSIESSQKEVEDKLNVFGAEGWDLVSVVWKKHSDRTAPTGRFIYYFKRNKQDKLKTPDVENQGFHAVVVELLNSGKARLGKEELKTEELITKLSRLDKDAKVNLRAEAQVKIEFAMKTYEALKKLGLSNVTITSK